MPENFIRNKGRPSGYKFDRGGAPVEFGPYVGIVMNNVDPTMSGRIQVFIEEFGAIDEDKNDPSNWRTLSYVSPFYGRTTANNNTEGDGTFVGNSHSYGMWFTPPDVGARVLCVFAAGDANQGYYFGSIAEPESLHMVPGVAATRNSTTGDLEPVTEINYNNPDINRDPRFFEREKPVHAYASAVLMQQGLIDDMIRGVISSSANRESPSRVYGISTPGRPVYRGGYTDDEVRAELESGSATNDDMKVIARRGGHSFVMDDGDLEGNNQLIRIRTSKGHQITMSDDGNSFYLAHANGQSWVELGTNGTIDLYSSNSVNVRSEGSINFHADDDVNIYAGRKVNIRSKDSTTVEAGSKVGLRSDGTVALVSAGKTSIYAAGNFAAAAPRIDLNDVGTLDVPAIPINTLPDSGYELKWDSTGQVTTVVTRAPTHEPFAAREDELATTKVFPREQLNTDVANYIKSSGPDSGKVDPPEY